MLAADAVLFQSVQRNGTLKGMVGVYWKGRHYSVYLLDLLQKTIATARIVASSGQEGLILLP